jgi:hypothetical protein
MCGYDSTYSRCPRYSWFVGRLVAVSRGSPVQSVQFVKGYFMAQKVTVSLVDDLSGSRADETVSFGLDGKNYEIDLSSGNAEKLRVALAGFVAAARKPGGSRRASVVPARRPSVDREQNQAIREWARKKGMKVNDRGRIPSKVVEAFQAS